MALTASQTAYFDAVLGPGTWTEGDLTARLGRLADDRLVAAEVVADRIALLRERPLSFGAEGYTENRAGNLAAYEKLLASLGGIPREGTDEGIGLRLVAPGQGPYLSRGRPYRVSTLTGGQVRSFDAET